MPNLRNSLVVILTLSAGVASGPVAAQSGPAPTCTGPEYRQFDFWVGEWDVLAPNGQPAGTNSIRLILGDCVLEENWTGSQGGQGRSLNAWDSQRRVWHQTWVDTQGTVLLLDGGLEGADMVMRGETIGQGGAKVQNRITWQARNHDEVRQLWEVSSDGGQTWTVAFDGKYVRRK